MGRITANLKKAVGLNPRDVWQLQNLALNYQMLRNFDMANQAIDRALALNPTAFSLLEIKSKLALAEKGDFSVAEAAFESSKWIPLTDEQKLRVATARAEVRLLERRFSEASRQAQNLPDDQLSDLPDGLWQKYYYIGFARKALHDEAGARAAFLKAKSPVEEQLKRSPDDEDAHVQLAKLLAYLGEKDSALAEAHRATELLAETKDAFGGSEITVGVAEVQTILGDNDRAIQILDGLLRRPSAVTVESLKINPIWDPLRSDPRFQKLCEEKRP